MFSFNIRNSLQLATLFFAFSGIAHAHSIEDFTVEWSCEATQPVPTASGFSTATLLTTITISNDGTWTEVEHFEEGDFSLYSGVSTYRANVMLKHNTLAFQEISDETSELAQNGVLLTSEQLDRDREILAVVEEYFGEYPPPGRYDEPAQLLKLNETELDFETASVLTQCTKIEGIAE
ncbi:MAG: hypothetical protein CMK07_14020 [Ponticaulis sp.]|nr:hypothetical protein [Ponticaulis sp.]